MDSDRSTFPSPRQEMIFHALFAQEELIFQHNYLVNGYLAIPWGPSSPSIRKQTVKLLQISLTSLSDSISRNKISFQLIHPVKNLLEKSRVTVIDSMSGAIKKKQTRWKTVILDFGERKRKSQEQPRFWTTSSNSIVHDLASNHSRQLTAH